MTDRRYEAGDEARPDLAALAVPLTKALLAMENRVLPGHGLTMWGYVVLTALAAESMRTQAALAEAIGADKTRLIAVLDDLQERGLIEREPDPDDRRVRLLSITAAGRRLHRRARADIRAQEQREFLVHLAPAERTRFLQALARLSCAVGE